MLENRSDGDLIAAAEDEDPGPRFSGIGLDSVYIISPLYRRSAPDRGSAAESGVEIT
jgi:hypothetical protein